MYDGLIELTENDTGTVSLTQVVPERRHSPVLYQNTVLFAIDENITDRDGPGSTRRCPATSNVRPMKSPGS